MTPPTCSNPIDRLRPEVADFTTPGFSVRSDLENLIKVQQAGAAEATVLYCGRILEALTRWSIDRVGLPASTNLASNLETLRIFNILPKTTCYWAQNLRRLGNQARHVQRVLCSAEAECAMLFIQRWLDWFFVSFPYGLRLTALTTDRRPLGLETHAELGALMALFDSFGSADDVPAAGELMDMHEIRVTVAAVPAAAAVLAELLLDGDESDAAGQVLSEALERSPLDLRLLQLAALRSSRTGDFAAALEILEPLYRKGSDDEETIGILAGTYKRMWSADSSNTEFLRRAQRLYRTGWVRSRRANAYLGINAASAALWLGRETESQHLAADVRALLENRQQTLAKCRLGPTTQLDYWNQATLAEAQLLIGALATAAVSYQQAFTQSTAQRGSVDVTRQQMQRILAESDLGDQMETLLARAAAEKT